MKQRNRSQMSVAEIPFEIWCFLQCKRPQDPIPRVHPPMFNLLAPWQGPSSFQKKQQQKVIKNFSSNSFNQCYVSKISFRCNCMSTISNLRLGRVNLHRLLPQKNSSSQQQKKNACSYHPNRKTVFLPSIFRFQPNSFRGMYIQVNNNQKKGLMSEFVSIVVLANPSIFLCSSLVSGRVLYGSPN